MIDYLKTALAFAKNIKTTGAISETSKWVIRDLTKPIDRTKKQVIIEFGAGHGNITKAALAKMHPKSKLYAFEIHEEFCEVLRQIGDPRLQVICDSAENVDQHVNPEESVDCIISSIPFTFIPDDVLHEILANSYSLLKNKAYMMQVLYSGRHLKHYKKFFSRYSTKLALNFPPANIYTCQKVES